MNPHLLAAEIVLRLPALAADNAQNAATVIESLIAVAESKDILKVSLATAQRTLRDEFAMAAMPAVISTIGPQDSHKSESEILEQIARESYAVADCMMAARK